MDSIYHTHKPEGGGDYLKLKDGDKVKMRIASEPAVSVYKRGQNPRYSWIVFNREKDIAQVYTAGVSVYNQIADLVDEWGDPKGFDITIKRTGSGMQDTSYNVSPVKESRDLTSDELEVVKAMDLIKLSKGKWLAEYAEDAQLPPPISDSPSDILPDNDPPPSDADAPPPSDDDLDPFPN